MSRACRYGVAAVAVVLLVTGCGGGTGGPGAKPSASASVSPTPTPSATPTPTTAGGKALAALQTAVADLGAVEVSGGAQAGGEAGQMHAVADLATGSFRTSVVLPNGIGTLQMIRILDTTWTKAGPAFWTDAGYTKESARAVRGKWVVETAENVKTLVAELDPAATIRSLLALKQSDVDGLGTVRSGSLQGNRVLRFGTGDETQKVIFSRGAKPRLLRIASTRKSTTTVVDFRILPQVHVGLPRAKDVFQPSS